MQYNQGQPIGNMPNYQPSSTGIYNNTPSSSEASRFQPLPGQSLTPATSLLPSSSLANIRVPNIMTDRNRIDNGIRNESFTTRTQSRENAHINISFNSRGRVNSSIGSDIGQNAPSFGSYAQSQVTSQLHESNQRPIMSNVGRGP